ncbi:uncharacterized protein LOC134175109 [Pezoporus occidentalis]|uniref:uncharacterized protein LOC134175109 n=1 Tax=Pezoporus occidentalis TaxID=407982 RepID=UPI002F90DBF5
MATPLACRRRFLRLPFVTSLHGALHRPDGHRASAPPTHTAQPLPVPLPPAGLPLGARGWVVPSGGNRCGTSPCFSCPSPCPQQTVIVPLVPAGPLREGLQPSAGGIGHTGEEQCRPAAVRLSFAEERELKLGGHRWKHIYMYNICAHRCTHICVFLCVYGRTCAYTYMCIHTHVCARMDGHRCAHSQLPARTGGSDRRFPRPQATIPVDPADSSPTPVAQRRAPPVI